jgi:hypothetical protein
MRRLLVCTICLLATQAASAQAVPRDKVVAARTIVLKPSDVPISLEASTRVLGRLKLALYVSLYAGAATPGRLVKRVRAPVEGFPASSRVVSLTVRRSSEPNTALFTIRWHVTPSVGTISLTYRATASSLAGPLQ